MNETAIKLKQSLDASGVRNKAMLVSLSISTYQGRKHDAEVSGRAASDYNAQAKAGRYNKMLIDRKYLDPINTLVSQMRNEHYRLTLPWLDNGQRILTVAHYERYCERINELQDQFTVEVNRFLDNYERAKAEAKKYLADMYREGDYLSREQIEDRFAVDWYMMPMPDSADFRIDLDEAELERTSAKLETALYQGQQEAWKRLREVVERIGDACRRYGDGSRAQLSDRIIDNLIEVADLAPGLNVLDNPRMNELAEDIRTQLGSHGAQTLKREEGMRKRVANEADELLRKMRHAMAIE